MNISSLSSAWMPLLIIVGAAFLLGWLIIHRWASLQRPFQGSLLELTFISLTMGIIVVGWLAFLLAEIGQFSILSLALLLGGLSLFLALRARRNGYGWYPVYTPTEKTSRPFLFLPGWVEYAALGVWLITAVFLFLRPHQFVVGGADAGVYVNLGANIAQTGSILIQDDLLSSLPTKLYPAFLRPLNNPVAPQYIMPAFHVIGEPVGQITPHFYHLHPVWQAIASGLSGGNVGSIQAELLLPGLWALLGALAVYFTVRRIAGWEAAFLTLAGLSLNALQIWFARYPTTETLTQFLLWASFWSLGVWLRNPEKRPLWGLLAGLTLGQSFLVRIDMLFVLPILGLLGLWLWVRDGWKRDHNWFFLPLLLLVLHSLLHALWQSRPYFFELFGFALSLLRINWYIPVGAGLSGVVLLLGLGRYRRQFTPVKSLATTISDESGSRFCYVDAVRVVCTAVPGPNDCMERSLQQYRHSSNQPRKPDPARLVSVSRRHLAGCSRHRIVNFESKPGNGRDAVHQPTNIYHLSNQYPGQPPPNICHASLRPCCDASLHRWRRLFPRLAAQPQKNLVNRRRHHHSPHLVGWFWLECPRFHQPGRLPGPIAST